MLILKEGDTLKVKRNPRGIMVSGGKSGDFLATSGEAGTVVRSPYDAWEGTPMASWSIDFSRGRSFSLTTPEARNDGNYSSGSSVTCCFRSDEDERLFIYNRKDGAK